MTEVSSGRSKHEESRRDRFRVVINGTPYDLEDETVTYEQLGDLAAPGHGPDVLFTVTYRNAHTSRGGNGTLVAGESVRVRNEGTSFDVRLTTRS